MGAGFALRVASSWSVCFWCPFHTSTQHVLNQSSKCFLCMVERKPTRAPARFVPICFQQPGLAILCGRAAGKAGDSIRQVRQDLQHHGFDLDPLLNVLAVDFSLPGSQINLSGLSEWQASQSNTLSMRHTMPKSRGKGTGHFFNDSMPAWVSFRVDVSVWCEVMVHFAVSHSLALNIFLLRFIS